MVEPSLCERSSTCRTESGYLTYIITVRLIASGEPLKQRKGLRIAAGYGSHVSSSSRFALIRRARQFQRAPRDDLQEVLNALVALGLARRLDDNRYAP